MKRNIYIIFFLSIFSAVSYGQTFNAYMNAAEKAYTQNKYYTAYKYLQEAYEFDTTRLDILYRSADMARLYSAFDLAGELYQKIVDRDTDNMFPKATYYLGEMLQRQGKYEDAIENFSMYLSENEGDDEYFTEKAKKEKKASEYAQDQMKNPDTSVKITKKDNINTNFSEVGAIEKNGKLYFSSLRFLHPEPENVRDPKYISKILVSEDGDAGTVLDELDEKTKLTAHTAFSNKTNKIYYSVCDYTEGTEKIKCDLYSRSVNSDGSYGEPEKLPSFINSDQYTTTQPAIGFDNETNKEILYFVSDRDKGKGKFDIWYSIIDDNMNFTQPKNLDSLNTPENDVTPFFHIPSNTLYFSSQGYQGFGGYDIYRSEKLNGHYAKAEHLENPVNSSYDDLYYSLSNDLLKGYLSSNREGASYIEDIIEACCFDIYEAKYEPVNLSLNAITCEDIDGNQRSLEGATVILINARNNHVIDSITNMEGDEHEFELERNKEYLIVAKKEHYHPDTVKLSTHKVYKSKTFTKNICLIHKTLDLDVFTFDDLTKLALSGASVTIEDLTDNTLRILDDFNPDSNDFHFKVREGHTYRITGTRENYESASVDLDLNTAEIIEGRVRQDLFLSFGPMYLPLTLYFDNDKPDSKTTKRTSDVVYTDSYNEYYARKSEFVEKSSDSERISRFFEEDLKQGFETLQIFFRGMQRALESGKKIEITVRGYTSPRSSSNYNLYLGQRRVQSVQNEINAYMDGYFKKYLDSGQLIITEVSYGETLVPEGVSDDINDEKNSIFSYEASKERRVQIINANQIKN